MALAAAPAVPAVRSRGEALELADGIELIGEFEGSGFKEPPHLARRADGQVIQLTRLLYLVAEACDGRRDAGEVAAVVSGRCGRAVSAGNVRFLVEQRLRPLGVLALADGSTPALPKRAPLLALRHRKPLVPEPRTVSATHRPAATAPPRTRSTLEPVPISPCRRLGTIVAAPPAPARTPAQPGSRVRRSLRSRRIAAPGAATAARRLVVGCGPVSGVLRWS